MMTTATDSDLQRLLRDHTAEELILALRVIEIAREFECEVGDLPSAIRTRSEQIRGKRAYYARHKEELKKKSRERMQARRKNVKASDTQKSAEVASQ